jgi:WS/DGAT C-terminal domain
VPADQDTDARLRWITSAMRAHRAARRHPTHCQRRPAQLPAGQPGTRERGESAGPLGMTFRGLARVRLFQALIDHQPLVNTFVTNVRGPTEPLHFSGHRVRSIIPVAVTPGNVGVTFDVLSYAGGWSSASSPTRTWSPTRTASPSGSRWSRTISSRTSEPLTRFSACAQAQMAARGGDEDEGAVGGFLVLARYSGRSRPVRLPTCRPLGAGGAMWAGPALHRGELRPDEQVVIGVRSHWPRSSGVRQ